ncbi:MAG: hypothetical protein DRJ69_03730, partial [Thermoprotei archaeon]
MVVRELFKVVEESSVDPNGGSTLTALTPVFKKHQVSLAYLFGSRARGTAREDCDYDIAVLFAKEPTIIDEINLSIELAKALQEPVDRVDVVSLNRDDTLIKRRVLKEGVLIYYGEEQLKRKWERAALN